MHLYVDFSVLTPTEAVGNVHGRLEVAAVPSQGAVVAFDRPCRAVAVAQIDKFPMHLRVQRVLPAVASADAASLVLEDAILNTVEDARTLMKYMEEGFGLYADEYDKA